MKKQVCIIGCGTLGCYLARRLFDLFGDQFEITILEMGDRRIRDEQQLGVEAVGSNTRVASHGRFFGLGGTSARWGGQVLFFDPRDNPADDPLWQSIIDIDARHQSAVLQTLLGDLEPFNEALEALSHPTSQGTSPLQPFLKTGLWLRYDRRNLYRTLLAPLRHRVKILPRHRVTGFHVEGGQLIAVIVVDESGHRSRLSADRFYLTAGALESCRLLLFLQRQTGLPPSALLGRHFGDHISTELFVVHNALPVLDGIDFTPHIRRGSLVTRRLVARADNGMVGFVHFVFNKEVQAFRLLKDMLFGKGQARPSVNELFSGAAFLFRLGWHAMAHSRLFVHPGAWSVQLDMEQSVPNGNFLALGERTDAAGVPRLHIHWRIEERDLQAIESVRAWVEEILRRNGLNYEARYQPGAPGNKIEDVYHPVGCIAAGTSEEAPLTLTGRVKGLKNLWHFSTAMLPSARSINPTAAVMCHIEEHLSTEPPLKP